MTTLITKYIIVLWLVCCNGRRKKEMSTVDLIETLKIKLRAGNAMSEEHLRNAMKSKTTDPAEAKRSLALKHKVDCRNKIYESNLYQLEQSSDMISNAEMQSETLELLRHNEILLRNHTKKLKPEDVEKMKNELAEMYTDINNVNKTITHVAEIDKDDFDVDLAYEELMQNSEDIYEDVFPQEVFAIEDDEAKDDEDPQILPKEKNVKLKQKMYAS